MNSENAEFRLGFSNVSSQGGPDDLAILSAYLENWKTVQRRLARYEFSRDEVQIKLNFDWSACVKDIETHIEISRTPPEQLETYLKSLDPWTTRFVNLEIQLNSNNGSKDFRFYIELFLYRLFLMMNISAPGSADFYLTSITPKGLEENAASDEKIPLASVLIDQCWTHIRPWDFSSITHLPLDHVLDWFEEPKLEQSNYAENSLTRALYALLHLCIYDGFSYMQIIWQAHAIEALYKNQHESNVPTRILCGRIINFLEIPSEKSQLFRKEFQKFYDLRHGFVHGSSKIDHPLEWRWMGAEEDPLLGRRMDAINFASPLIIATLQKLVRAKSYALRFEEQVFPD